MKKILLILCAVLFVSGVVPSTGFATEARLISAAKYGNTRSISKYLGQGLSVNTADKYGRTLLVLAAAYGRYPAAKMLIDEGADVNINDRKGKTALHYLAARKSRKALDVMTRAINRGANIEFADFSKKKETPAAIAINKNNLPALELLISKGFDHGRYINSMPMAIYAYQARRTTIMKALAAKGADINAQNSSGETLIHLAAARYDLSTVKYLLQKGAAYDRKDAKGRTPLFRSVEKNYLKMAALFIAKGSDVNTSDNLGRNIMHLFAAGRSRGKTISLYAKYGITINKKDKTGNSPLMTAVGAKRWENVKYLIGAGADFTFTDDLGKTLLMRAIEKRQSYVASYLAGKGVDVKAADNSGRTALHRAAALKGRTWYKLVSLMIQKGADVNVADSEGISPAGIAIDANNISGFRILLKNGLNVNYRERKTDPLVLYAYKKYRKTIFAELSKRGADTSLKDGNGDSLLHLIAEKGDSVYYRTISAMNPDLNVTNNSGKTPLLLAVEKRRYSFAKKLLSEQGKINLKHKDNEGMSVLHYLASYKSAPALLAKITTSPEWVGEEDGSGRTPLAISVHSNLIKNAGFFIKSGADVNGKDWKESKLVIAAYGKGRSMMNLFLDNGAKPDSVNPDGKTLIYMAIEKYDLTAVKSLVERGVSVNKKYENGNYPVIHSIERKRPKITEFFISTGADLNVKNSSGTTPLIAAVTQKNYRTCSLLIGGGADVKVKNSEGKTILFIAYDKYRSDIFGLLLKGGALPAETFENGNTFLHLAAMGNKLSFIRVLVENNAKMNVLNNDGKTALLLAAEKGYSNSVKYLIKGSPDLNIKDQSGDTALFKCIKARGNGAYYSAKYLVAAGADMNNKNRSGSPLLHEAAAGKKFTIVSLFLKNGADTNILNKKKETLIMALSKTPYTGSKDRSKSTQAAKLIKELTAKGSNADLADKYGRTPLSMACRQKNMIVIEALIKGGANIDGPDKSGNTPLKKTVMSYIGDYRTSAKEKSSVIKLIDYLIKGGADINSRDRFGRTALSHIVKEANQKNYKKVSDLVPVLTSRGATKDIKDNEGKSASDYGAQSSIDEIREIVR